MGRRLNKNRQPPTKRQLVEALINPWVLFDLLNFHGGRKAFGECHRELVEFGFESDYECGLALMPRGHLKTTLNSVGRALYAIYVNPNIRIYTGSAHKDLSRAILREVSSNLVDEWNQEHIWNKRPHFKGRLVPIMDKALMSRKQTLREMTDEERDEEREYKKVMWNADAIQVIAPYKLREPTMAVGSTESIATGFHFDLLIFDDIISFDNYDTQDKAARLDRWRDDMMSVLDPIYFDEDLYDALCAVSRSPKYRDKFHKLAHVGGQISVSGTRYFKDDWYGQIEAEIEQDLQNGEKPIWSVHKRNIYANGVDNSEGYLWKEKWNPNMERSKRKKIKKAEQWYSQYLNKIIVEEMQSLPFDLVNLLSPANMLYDEDKPGVVSVRVAGDDKDFSRVIKLCMVVDPAATYSKRSDFTSIGVGGYDDLNNFYLVDGRLLKVHTDEWVNTVFDLAAKWGIRVFNLETVAFAATLKIVFHKMFASRFPLTIKDYRPPSQVAKKDRIENQLEPIFKNGMFYMNAALGKSREVQDQLNFFPSTKVHDDFPDMLAMLAEIAKPTNQKIYGDRPRRHTRQRFNKVYGGVY